MTRVVMDSGRIERALEDIAAQLVRADPQAAMAVVGIRRGGENLAARLASSLRRRTGQAVPLGMVDVTLYRDDGFGPADWPTVGVTHIDFDLTRHVVVLVDDVLYTGRTVRAAIDAILDYGRPRAVRLAVLVDRGLRELPIRADAVGLVLPTQAQEHVDVAVSPSASPDDCVRIVARPEAR